MHPREAAARDPGKPAIIMSGSGAVLAYGELTERANRAAKLFRALGLAPGDGIALCMENHPRFFEVCWAAHDAGLYYTPISCRLRQEEIAYIVRDCGARAFITTAGMAREVAGLGLGPSVQCYMIDGTAQGFRSWEAALQSFPGVPLADDVQGVAMVYSSGTTGRPKGIRPPLPGLGVDQPAPLAAKLLELYRIDADTVYLSPAPLYHAAPLKFTLAVLAAGGTAVVMEKFDPEAALQCIDRHRVTHSQWVPTMFFRMLKLPAAIRAAYRGGSHRVAIHAAAPCPVEIKQRMLQWWGPIIYEYYSGSESIGMCAITPQEWLEHRGSVGRPMRGVLHIVDEQGVELPAGATGLVYFEAATPLRYHNDAEKTARAHNERGWATMGDIGHVDAEGYLYLTDRRDYVIISGGVNIYPREAEDLLETHPKVLDVAVFGVPNEEFGEEVKAVVVPRHMQEAGAQLQQELIDYCRARLSAIKCPRSVDFSSQLPREPTGKLLKKQLRQQYWDAWQAGQTVSTDRS